MIFGGTTDREKKVNEERSRMRANDSEFQAKGNWSIVTSRDVDVHLVKH